MADTFLFYDTETSGLNRAFDQILEFAAIRTDLKLNERFGRSTRR
jgi:exodeoxyribonuclease I